MKIPPAAMVSNAAVVGQLTQAHYGTLSAQRSVAEDDPRLALAHTVGSSGLAGAAARGAEVLHGQGHLVIGDGASAQALRAVQELERAEQLLRRPELDEAATAALTAHLRSAEATLRDARHTGEQLLAAGSAPGQA